MDTMVEDDAVTLSNDGGTSERSALSAHSPRHVLPNSRYPPASNLDNASMK